MVFCPLVRQLRFYPSGGVNYYSFHLWGTHLMCAVVVHHMDDADLMDDAGLIDDAKFLFFLLYDGRW